MRSEGCAIRGRAGASSPRRQAEDGPAHPARSAIALLIFSVGIFLSGSALAQQIRVSAESSTSQPTVVQEPYSYPRIILAMGVVVGLILVLKWGAARLTPAIAPKSGKAMQILSRLPVGPKQQLLLIKVGKRAVLVGHAGAQMNPLCEISDADELAHLVGHAEAEKGAPRGAFASLFQKRERDFEPTQREMARAVEPEEDEELAQLARRELLGLTQRVRGLSEEMNGV